MLGVDYPWTHPTPAAMQAAEVAFAFRYLSKDSSKNLSRAEADALAARGIWVGVVWETTAGRALDGRAAGTADAREALRQAQACGMPAGRPIYFAVDTDTTWAAVQPYFLGVRDVLPASQIGVYGGIKVVAGAADSGLVSWYWQAYAWSAGRWEPRAHVRQLGYITIGGVQCDRNESMTSDYGQWMPGRTPEEDDDMPTADEIAQAVWNYPVPVPRRNADGTVRYEPNKQGASWPLVWGNIWSAESAARDAALQAAVASLAGLLSDQHADLTAEQVQDAVKAAIAESLVHVQVDVAAAPHTV
jgi:2-hydroxychromene-2-carboxylate isomerase